MEYLGETVYTVVYVRVVKAICNNVVAICGNLNGINMSVLSSSYSNRLQHMHHTIRGAHARVAKIVWRAKSTEETCGTPSPEF